jgi:cytochrome b involved in lipid metabolism
MAVMAPAAAPDGNVGQTKSGDTAAAVLSDTRWSAIKWTVYRGVAYELTPEFISRHPGGEWLINLAVGRE